jgi:excisionase family DNA binding protein
MTKTTDAPELIGSAEACDLLGIDRATLSRWAQSGRLTPFHKGAGIRGAYLFRRSDVDQLVQPGVREASGS